MLIIIDTREQKPLQFTGHETTYRKLDEGDYNIAELEDKIVIERKSAQDLYGSIIQDHKRFRNEIKRAIKKNKKFYIFLEGSLINFYFYKSSIRPKRVSAGILEKILLTMKERYGLIFVECKTRRVMSKKIIELLNEEKKNYGV